MARGKNINVYLMDGTADGCIKCTLANWTGIAFKIPRTDLEKCRNREELKQSGVYFLFGETEQTGKPAVYVGQAGARKNGEGILCRLREHKRSPEKDYWTEAVVFTTTNNSFGPTEISYLENRFCNLAIRAGRYDVKNGNDPSPGQITEEKESEMEEYVDNARIIMGMLGHKVFLPYTQPAQPEPDTPNPVDIPEVDLFLPHNIKKDSFTAEAHAKQTAEGFVVLPGSRIAPNETDSIIPGVREKRRTARIDENRILQENVLFTSPSGAAMFVIGKTANGWNEWKTKDGLSLRDLEAAEG